MSDVDRFYPHLAAVMALDRPKPRVVYLARDGGRKRTLSRKRSEFDDTWTKHYEPEAGEDDMFRFSSSESSSRRGSEAALYLPPAGSAELDSPDTASVYSDALSRDTSSVSHVLLCGRLLTVWDCRLLTHTLLGRFLPPSLALMFAGITDALEFEVLARSLWFVSYEDRGLLALFQQRMMKKSSGPFAHFLGHPLLVQSTL